MSFRIERITMREIRLPLKEPFEISSGTLTSRRILLIYLEGNGAAVWSECVADEAPNYYPDTIVSARATIRDWIAPQVFRQSFRGPEEVHDLLQQDIRGHTMAKAAVEMGVWGLASVLQDISLARLLGGTREKIAVGISVGIQKSPEVLAKKVRTYADEGYQKIKIKIKPHKDIEYIRAAREAVGPDVHLMADANNAYTLDDLERLRQLDVFGLMMIEQPLAWDDLVRHATLQKSLKTPICLDESISSVERAEDMIMLESGRIINIKPGRVGGFTSSKRIHDLCQRHAIPVWCGGMLEAGIGRAYNVALASLPNFLLPGDISPSQRYWQRDIVIPEWTMNQGYVDVPTERKGIGVDIDEAYIDELTQWKEVLHL
jgi:o-succinylbenzoate synthase